LDATAVIIGASGGVGAALVRALEAERGARAVLALGRPALELTDEARIVAVAERLSGLRIDLVIDATGFLHDEAVMPERSWRELDPVHMAKAFALNAIGPALVMKHILPLLPRGERSVFATLSARVGSIGDNRLGGWHSYRASKAALNQLVRTCAIELALKRPQAICVALHPGTVATRLSAPFSKSGLDVRPPDEAAGDILRVLNALTPADTGGFFDHRGAPVPF